MMIGKDFVDKPVQLSPNKVAPIKTGKFLPIKAQLIPVPEENGGIQKCGMLSCAEVG